MIKKMPIKRKEIPQSAKNAGASEWMTCHSQKNAKPPQRRLNGIMKTSAPRNTIPCLGWPDHNRRSPPESSDCTCCSTLIRCVENGSVIVFVPSPFIFSAARGNVSAGNGAGPRFLLLLYSQLHLPRPLTVWVEAAGPELPICPSSQSHWSTAHRAGRDSFHCRRSATLHPLAIDAPVAVLRLWQRHGAIENTHDDAEEVDKSIIVSLDLDPLHSSV